MVDDASNDEALQTLIDRFHRGDPGARDELIERSCGRLRKLTQRLLSDFPSVARWEQTDDIFQQCVLVLYRSLEQVRPQSVRALMGLAAVQIRRKLIDLARHYQGPEGMGANHDTGSIEWAIQQPALEGRPELFSKGSPGPMTLQMWTEFHETIERLPLEEKEVFDLVYYQGLSQVQAAQMLELSERTVKRRWRNAKLLLHDWLKWTGSE